MAKQTKHSTKKQQFLDQTATSNDVWFTQTILTQMSKTDISEIRRKLKKIIDTTYKSWVHDMSLKDLYSSFIAAEELNKPENDGDNLEK